jgi:hypothetical protein
MPHCHTAGSINARHYGISDSPSVIKAGTFAQWRWLQANQSPQGEGLAIAALFACIWEQSSNCPEEQQALNVQAGRLWQRVPASADGARRG